MTPHLLQKELSRVVRLESKRSVMLWGPPGVGKSSIIAALLPHEDLRIGALSEAESKGRNTTTAARHPRSPRSCLTGCNSGP